MVATGVLPDGAVKIEARPHWLSGIIQVRFRVQQFTQEGRKAVADMAARYQLSPETVEHMLVAVNNGAGTMAQFNCPELGGSGQWMRGGMTMVGDMFNSTLKSTVDRLCNDLSELLTHTQVFTVTSAEKGSSHAQWWPDGLGSPLSSGSQNNSRYAVFSDRLAVDVDGKVTVYDTRGHRIGGVSQQQGGSNSLTFSSQLGTISVDGLPVVSVMAEAEGENADSDSGPESATTSSQTPATPETRPSTSQSAAKMPSLQDHPAVQITGQQAANAESDRSQQAASTSASASAAADVETPTISGGGGASTSSPADQGGAQAANGGTHPGPGSDILALIEKLAQLHGAGILNDEEFSAKKRELLARI
ncbi:SHOCT domain-containing protein [Granulosicoccus sp. 3-233]|uniref:SHOCT domain-containing protein n=1 Tax=Granulosicoccus sp. 3-233 TaxID=3417969 RepID=UPI003D324882